MRREQHGEVLKVLGVGQEARNDDGRLERAERCCWRHHGADAADARGEEEAELHRDVAERVRDRHLRMNESIPHHT